eukprot:5950434-Pyramimonas_sp.AAC.1
MTPSPRVSSCAGSAAALPKALEAQGFKLYAQNSRRTTVASCNDSEPWRVDTPMARPVPRLF